MQLPFNLFLFSLHLLFSLTVAYTPNEHILLSCGATSLTTTSEDGRNWATDEGIRFSNSNPHNSSFVSEASSQDYSIGQVPYMTARVFRDKFTYSFPVLPGLKFLRFYFYPAQYSGFDATTSFFSVTANNYLLFKNFSAYLTLSAEDTPAAASLIKEFMVPVFETESLNVTFTPSPNSLAFVNGIEVVSMPDNLYRNDHQPNSVSFVNNGDVPFDVPNATAFETAYRLNVGGAAVSNIEDTGMFRTWIDDSPYIFGAAAGITPHGSNVTITYTQDTPEYTAPVIVYTTSRTMGPNPAINMNYNLTWDFPIDTGFNYLLRLHFCETEVDVTKEGQRVFDIYINNKTADWGADVIGQSGGNSKPVYSDYVVWIPNEGPSKQVLWLALHPTKGVGSRFADAILNGLEIFRLNSSDGSLAVPNPEPNFGVRQKEPFQISRKKSKRSLSSSLVRVIVGAASCAAILSLSLFLYIKLLPRNQSSHRVIRRSMELPDKLCHCFTLAEIRAATDDFNDDFVVGSGGFGNVYKGFIEGTNSLVAIKRLNSKSHQGATEFWAEIQMLSQLRHTNLVSLIGYCNDDNEMILVYDYMANGTLRDKLCNTDIAPLSWKQRLEICIGAARGLDYLHSGAIHRVIHRDVKSTNILLDENFVAKVSDFGLSKMSPISMTDVPVTTVVKGSFGYMDPEYYRRQQVTEKSDVYSFGVVLFEVLCGRPAVDSKLEFSRISLANWARRCVENETIAESIDPFLKGKIAPYCLRTFAKIAEHCIRENGIERPTMGDVVQTLELALQLHETKDAEQISE